MAATIITIGKVGDSSTNIEIKVNDGHTVPTNVVTDTITSFRTWVRDKDHLFIWTNAAGREMSMAVPCEYIGYVMSSMPIGIEGDRFRIDAPCAVAIMAEIP